MKEANTFPTGISLKISVLQFFLHCGLCSTNLVQCLYDPMAKTNPAFYVLYLLIILDFDLLDFKSPCTVITVYVSF